MKNKIEKFIIELNLENQKRSDKLNSGELDEYAHTVNVHQYNYAIDIMNRLEKIIKES